MVIPAAQDGPACERLRSLRPAYCDGKPRGVATMWAQIASSSAGAWLPICVIEAQGSATSPPSTTESTAVAVATPIPGAGVNQATLKDRVAGFAAGIASGATKLCVGHPFDTIKIRLQTEGTKGRFSGVMDCLSSTVRKEGIRALYKGATPPLIGWSIMDAVQLGSLSNYRLILKGGDKSRQLSHLEHGVAGLFAGWTVALVATPVETLKVRLQTQYQGASSNERRLYSGPVDCARQLVRQNGVFGLWHGLHATMLQRSFFFFLWGSYSVYTQWLKSLEKVPGSYFLGAIPRFAWSPQAPSSSASLPPLTTVGKEGRKRLSEKTISFVAGGLAANTFWTLCFPLDVIKNRYMRINTLPKPTLRSIAKTIYRTEGLAGFFSGFWVTFVRSFPTNASAVFVFEWIMRTAKAH